MWERVVDWPALGGIHNGAADIRASASLYGVDSEFQPSQR